MVYFQISINIEEAVVVIPAYDAAQDLQKAYDVVAAQENNQVTLKEMARTLESASGSLIVTVLNRTCYFTAAQDNLKNTLAALGKKQMIIWFRYEKDH